MMISKSSRVEVVFLRKGVLKICSKFTEEHPCRNAISIKFLCNFIEITLCSRAKMILRNGLLKIYSKFTGEDPCQSAISIKLYRNFIEIALGNTSVLLENRYLVIEP